MKTLTINLNRGEGWRAPDDVFYGPPLPRSMQLWNLWGCYSHSKCLPLVNPVTNVVRHTPVEEFWTEHTQKCVGAPTCCYFVHWLVGELEEPGHSEYKRLGVAEAWMYDLSKKLS